MAQSKIDLSKDQVTGTLPVANGGTALTSGFNNGGLVLVHSSSSSS